MTEYWRSRQLAAMTRVAIATSYSGDDWSVVERIVCDVGTHGYTFCKVKHLNQGGSTISERGIY